jgi:hypothetical protein
MSIDINRLNQNNNFKVLDEDKKFYLADPFNYKIFPEDYIKLTEILIDNPEIFIELNKIQKNFEKYITEGTDGESLSKPVKGFASNLKIFENLKGTGNYNENMLRHLDLIKNYKTFFKEIGTSLKFNPLSERESAKQIRIKLHEFLIKYLNFIKPKILFQISKAGTSAASLILEDHDIQFHSHKLVDFFSNRNFPDSEKEIIIYIATISPLIDNEVKKLSKDGEIFDAYILNGIGSGAVEMAAKDLNLFMNDINEHESLRFKRFSPGYGDWRIEDQKKIFKILEPEKHIQVNLTESCIMIPEKSTSGIMGLTAKSY